MPIRPRVRTLVRAVGWTLVLGTGLAILLGRPLTELVLLDSGLMCRIGALGFAASVLALQLALILLGVAGVSVCCRARRLALVAVVAAFVGIVPALWRLLPTSAAPPAPGQSVLRVMALNVLFENATPQRVIDAVLEADPDVLFLAEYVAPLDDVIRPAIGERFPHQYVVLRQSNRGQAIFSKLPLVGAREHVFDTGGWNAPALVADVEWGDQPVRVVGVHLPSPITIDLLRQSCREARELAELAGSCRGDFVLAGDFNAPPTTRTYQILLEGGLQESFAQAGRGRGVTRPSEPFPPGELGGIRIDHIFASGSLRFVSSRVGPDVGSDHRPVIAEIVRR